MIAVEKLPVSFTGAVGRDVGIRARRIRERGSAPFGPLNHVACAREESAASGMVVV